MGSLCVANIDNEASGALKVVTGSLQGMLRVFRPGGREYAVDHQMLEVELDAAVLQLGAGCFTSNHPGLTLAVLQPRSVAVYAVTAVIGPAGAATHFDLRKLYEHYLEHSAANMCFGAFGNKQVRATPGLHYRALSCAALAGCSPSPHSRWQPDMSAGRTFLSARLTREQKPRHH